MNTQTSLVAEQIRLQQWAMSLPASGGAYADYAGKSGIDIYVEGM